uniref:Uncharacterized protein n=1 Tax=Brassica oleracea TaxID=3712 RepID=A0A3P6DNL8_BRAOL|nr:unnamed protein product [Brassica oleracea]
MSHVPTTTPTSSASLQPRAPALKKHGRSLILSQQRRRRSNKRQSLRNNNNNP